MRQLKLSISSKAPKNSNEVLMKIEEIKEELEARIEHELIEKNLLNFKGKLGFCHIYWNIKKDILKQNYGIEWFTPANVILI